MTKVSPGRYQVTVDPQRNPTYLSNGLYDVTVYGRSPRHQTIHFQNVTTGGATMESARLLAAFIERGSIQLAEVQA